MPNVLQVSVPTGPAALVWPSRASGVASLLFINQDLNNTVYLGQEASITAAGTNTIPLAPNGTFSGDASSPWYVVGSAAGTAPLVVVPNGQAYFLGITQGLGQLVIPSVRSPNFVTGVSGWQIAKNGSAEFNDITIRGALIEDADGLFYNGTPGAGTLAASITNAAGVDKYNNAFLADVTSYGQESPGNWTATQLGGTVAQGAAVNFYSATSAAGPWTLQASLDAESTGVLNINALKAIWLEQPMFAGLQLATGTANIAQGPLVGGNADGSMYVDNNIDTNTYKAGHMILAATATPAVPQTINSTSAQAVAGCSAVPVTVGAYRFTVELQYAGQQAAGVPNFQIGLGGGAAATILWGNARFHDAVAGTSGYVARPTALSPFAGPTLSTNNWMLSLEGYALFTTGGNVSLQAWTSVAADTYKISNAVFEVRQA